MVVGDKSCLTTSQIQETNEKCWKYQQKKFRSYFKDYLNLSLILFSLRDKSLGKNTFFYDKTIPLLIYID
jgi:hypothetical protein